MLRKDYMGVMVINHYVSKDPVDCFGSQIPVQAITEIAIYEGGYDDNGKVEKGSLLTKIRMSDLQFGRLIAKPNSSYHSTTLEALTGFDIDFSHLQQSPDVKKMSNSVSINDNKDLQIVRFLKEIESIANESKSKSRIVKRSELIRLLETLLNNAPKNLEYGFQELAEIATKRVSEVKSQLHSIIRNSYRSNSSSLFIENMTSSKERLSCLSSALISHNAGQRRLFDSAGVCHETVSLEANGDSAWNVEKALARHESNVDMPLSRSIHLSKRLVSVTMSLDQYARFVRSDNTDVPCTIHHVGRMIAKEPVLEDRKDELLAGSIDTKVLFSDLMSETAKALSIIQKSKSLKAEDRKEVINLCLRLSAIYDGMEDDIRENSKHVTSKIMTAYEEELQSFKEGELEKLSHDEVKRITKLLG